MPFCVARHGLLSKSASKVDITALYIATVKRSLGPFYAATLDAAIACNRARFALNGASFGSDLNTYYAASRCIAREILHVISSVPRGAQSDVIK